MTNMRVNNPNVILFNLVLLLMISCSSAPSNIQEYKAWFTVEENGFIRKQDAKDFIFHVTRKPAELMAMSEIQELPILEKSRVDSIVRTYDESEYFMLDIQLKDAKVGSNAGLLNHLTGDYVSYETYFKDLAFTANEHVELVINGDTLLPLIYHFEPTYELAKSVRLIFGFPKKNNSDEMTFIFDDELIGYGRLKFIFKPLYL